MRPPFLLCACLSLLVFHFPAQADPARTTREFEKWAAELPYLDLSALLYDSDRPRFGPDNPQEVETHNRILAEATDFRYSREELLALLNHKEAKVRTLAAAALFDREDPSVLPDLVKLCTDEAPTFKGHGKLSETWLQLTGIGPPQKEQSVGFITTAMLSFYMKYSGYHYGIEHASQPGFADYWEKRKHRSTCAAWFMVQLMRARNDGQPVGKGESKAAALRKRLEALPPDERAWTLLWLNTERETLALTSPEELLKAVQGLGPAKLKLMLQDKIPSDDPDLQPRENNNWPYESMRLYVLKNAGSLLNHSDADFLLANEKIYHSGWWAIAAAELQPKRASSILHAALKRFPDDYLADDRSDMAIALWKHCGEAEMPFLVNWFYTQDENQGSHPNPRGRFLEGVAKDRRPARILKALAADPRLEKNDAQSTAVFVRVVNGLLPAPVYDEEKLRKTYGPSADPADHKEWRAFVRLNAPRIAETDVDPQAKRISVK